MLLGSWELILSCALERQVAVLSERVEVSGTVFNLSDLYFANSVLVEMIAEILAQNDGISGSLRTISNNMHTWPLQIPSYITQRNPHRLHMEKENRKT
jgi:hypothetical protein